MRDGEATSFGTVAEDYDRVRPGPAADALPWLVPADCQVAVDLAAGTGLFTRALTCWVDQVIAVEPDPRMREVLTARSPGVRVLEGWGEAIPLPDASADAVFVSTAWHWLDPARAVPEIARVLRDGGRLGVLWTSRDRQVDWVAELDVLRAHGEPRTVDSVRAYVARENSVTLPEGAEFGSVRTASFGFTRTISVDDTLDWLATNSRSIMAGRADHEASRARCRAALLARSGGAATLEMPMRSECWRADRLDRPLPLAPGKGQTARDPAPGSEVALAFRCGD